MNGPLTIELHDGVPVGRLEGEVDISQTPFLRDKLHRAVESHHEGLVIDLTETTYLDSSVVGLLFELAERLATHQLRLAVVVPEGGLVERVLAIVDLGKVASLHRTLDDAVAALRSPGEG